MTAPTPLKTILCPTRYPYAVAVVQDGAITCTMGYATTLEDCYAQVQGWRGNIGPAGRADYIMAEMRDLDDTASYSYWCAV